MTLALPPIDDSRVRYDASPPGFEQLVSATLGNAGDPSDGFDADISAIMALFADTDQTGADIAAWLDDLGNASAAFPDWGAGLCKLQCPHGGPGHSPPPIPSLPCDNAPLTASIPFVQNLLDSAKLASVGGLTLGALPPPPGGGEPVQPPTICVPAPAPPDGTPPPGTIHPRIPPPIPVPIRSGCPAGTIWNPTTQTCEPCAPGTYFVATSGICEPNPPPPPPPPGKPPPVHIPVIIPAPCASGQVYDPVRGVCVPQEGIAWGPGVVLVGDTLILAGEAGAAATEATATTVLTAMLSGSLGVGVAVIAIIPVLGQVVAAFLAFNSLFGGDWTAEFNAWAAQMRSWYATQPVAATRYAVQQQLAQDQHDLQTGMLGEYARTQLLAVIAKEKARLAGLDACLAAGEFTSCPGYL